MRSETRLTPFSDTEYRGLDAEVSDHPFRCAKCSRMQPRGALTVWAADSSHFLDEEDWQSFYVGATQSSSHSGWCQDCVDRVWERSVPGAQSPTGCSRALAGLGFIGAFSLVMIGIILTIGVTPVRATELPPLKYRGEPTAPYTVHPANRSVTCLH